MSTGRNIQESPLLHIFTIIVIKYAKRKAYGLINAIGYNIFSKRILRTYLIIIC